MTSTASSSLTRTALTLAAALLLVAPVALRAQAPEAAPAVAPEPSEAERLVFMSTPFTQLKPPQTLVYRYRLSGSGVASPVEDEAALKLSAGGDGLCCDVTADFLSGPRKLNLPVVERARANPIVLFFLEREVRQLNEQTKGSGAYFRKRIRLALVDQAQVSTVQRQVGGRSVQAREVRVQPYLNDPNPARLDKVLRRQYVFVLSDAVPGQVLELRMVQPGAQDGAPPEREEVLSLVPSSPRAAP